MLFRQNYRISIPEPCHEDWKKMHPVDRGRFCDSCSKVVTDFSQMTEKEIAAFFRNKPTHVCGRFTNAQLDKRYVSSRPVRIPAHKRLVKFIMSIFLVSGTAKQVKSQSQDTIVVQADSLKQDSSLVFDNIPSDSLLESSDTIADVEDTTNDTCEAPELIWPTTIPHSVTIETLVMGDITLITGWCAVEPEEPSIFTEIKKRCGEIAYKLTGQTRSVPDLPAVKVEHNDPAPSQPKPIPAPQRPEAILPPVYSARGRKSSGNKT